ncbi:MAG: histidine kinase [Bacteroidales bacterium]|nr:histidine kinase [Bacteroidales bacterium]
MDARQAVINTFGFLIPIILPVIILDYLHNRFLIKKKYISFIIYGLITLGGFGMLNYYIIKWISSPESESNTLVSILVFFLIFSGIRYFQKGTMQEISIQKAVAEKAQAELALKQLESAKVRAELESLKSQLNPHFLFNTLNNIYSQIISKSEQAGDSVLKLSGLMRYILESAQNDRVGLYEEIRFLEDYIHMEQIRLEDQIRVDFRTKAPENIQMAPLVFIPFVENCFKHGISAEKDKNVIEIELTCTNHEVRFRTKNNIAPKRIHTDRMGKGLTNIKKRLELLYPSQHELEISNTDETFNVNLIIRIS